MAQMYDLGKETETDNYSLMKPHKMVLFVCFKPLKNHAGKIPNTKNNHLGNKTPVHFLAAVYPLPAGYLFCIKAMVSNL